MRVHGQEGVFQGHGVRQDWLPFSVEGDRRRSPILTFIRNVPIPILVLWLATVPQGYTRRYICARLTARL